jgi:hypothetical protein
MPPILQINAIIGITKTAKATITMTKTKPPLIAPIDRVTTTLMETTADQRPSAISIKRRAVNYRSTQKRSVVVLETTIRSVLTILKAIAVTLRTALDNILSTTRELKTTKPLKPFY